MTERASLDGTAGTHAELFEDDPLRAVRLRLDAGEEVPGHTHPGKRVMLHVVEGRLDLRVGDERHDLQAGELVRFSGDREVSPRTTEDAVALVVFAPE